MNNLYDSQSYYYSGLSGLNEQQFNIRKRLWDEKNGPYWISARADAQRSHNSASLSNMLFTNNQILEAYKYAFMMDLRRKGMTNDVEVKKLGSTFYNAMRATGELIGPFVPFASGYRPPSDVDIVNQHGFYNYGSNTQHFQNP